MAATMIQKFVSESPDALGYEVWKCAIGGAETECDITPSALKSIHFVSIAPMDATSAATTIGYVKGSTFVPGAGAVTIVGANSTTYLVKLEGSIA